MRHSIAFLSRFPPLEGGISAKTYWLATGLAKRGHDVHVITHPASAGREYNIPGGECTLLETANLHVHRPPEATPWHLPEDNEYSLALLDLALDVVKRHRIQVLDSGYLVPYGIVGGLTKRMTGVPHVVRHGGSDLEKFLKTNLLSNVLRTSIADADMVVTDEASRAFFESMTGRVVCHPPYVPDEQAFVPCRPPARHWRLAAIGKINHHWQHKGLDHVVEIMTALPPRFECLIVGQGKGMSDFQRRLDSPTPSKVSWQPFVPPWDMPGLLRSLDAVFLFETFLPHPVFSNLAVEALCAGIGIVTDRADFAETYADIVKAEQNQVLVVSPRDYLQSANAVAQWVQAQALAASTPCQGISFQDYLLALEETYEVLLASKA